MDQVFTWLNHDYLWGAIGVVIAVIIVRALIDKKR